MLEEKHGIYTCTRACFYLNKFFSAGDPFPENWLENGYQPGKHFANTELAAAIFETGQKEHHALTHGDDPRPNADSRSIEPQRALMFTTR
ncbi:MAG: hypothetical protein MUC57_09665 [Desulfobacterales bacterium]|jgi:hypothetical protein|nr:hypothetical protein [Desulfobacterales bacterium]